MLNKTYIIIEREKVATTRIVSIFRVVEIGIVAVQGEVWVGIWYFDIVICMKIALSLCVLDDFGL